MVPVWNKSKLEYGVFVANGVPFFIINFKEVQWNFDVSLNIKKIIPEKVDAWVTAPANIINLYLCDCNTNELLGMRMISIDQQLSKLIKRTLQDQDTMFVSANGIDSYIKAITKVFPTADMIAQTTMHAL